MTAGRDSRATSGLVRPGWAGVGRTCCCWRRTAGVSHGHVRSTRAPRMSSSWSEFTLLLAPDVVCPPLPCCARPAPSRPHRPVRNSPVPSSPVLNLPDSQTTPVIQSQPLAPVSLPNPLMSQFQSQSQSQSVLSCLSIPVCPVRSLLSIVQFTAPQPITVPSALIQPRSRFAPVSVSFCSTSVPSPTCVPFHFQSHLAGPRLVPFGFVLSRSFP